MQDRQQDDGAIRTGWISFYLWIAVFAGAFIASALTEPRDFGFTAGANRIVTFLGWQTAAGALAMLGLVLRRHIPRGRSLRWLLLIPPGVFLALILSVAALLLYASQPQPVALTPSAVPTNQDI
ncbi:hypothetical protein R3X27_21075 [Tropicimonas sp. TH_r6]|uniref:hypothetical protein n=1 Tax=Tropicimonas sp. TH_r6 TaxID=3082085 RepID=UPI0029541BA5|nr:hypothetical protein [Tropicimonas sp. TH_r6]MDV7145183.1 hypothetical protein [Tropicimonas sp. TH_r6]